MRKLSITVKTFEVFLLGVTPKVNGQLTFCSELFGAKHAIEGKRVRVHGQMAFEAS